MDLRDRRGSSREHINVDRSTSLYSQNTSSKKKSDTLFFTDHFAIPEFVEVRQVEVFFLNLLSLYKLVKIES